MTGRRSDAEYVLDLLGGDSGASLRRFLGGWSITLGGQQFAIIMDTVYAKAPHPSASSGAPQANAPSSTLQDPLSHQLARRVFVFRSEVGEIPQIQQAKGDSPISRPLREDVHALNLEHVLEERRAGHEGSTGHYAFVGPVIEQFD